MTEPWPAADLESVDACPACGATARSPLQTGLADRTFRIAPGEWSLMRCAECGSAFLDPRPTPESIGRAYAGDYITHGASGFEPEPVTAADRFRRAVRNGYVNRRFGYSLAPASPLGRLVGLIPPLRAEADRAFRHFPLPAQGARMLDVGCGNGSAAAFFAAAGWDVTGYEVDDDAAAQARASGLEVLQAPLDQVVERQAGRYALITLSHVVEHVHDPRVFLAQMRSLLAPGGHVWIATPNLGSAGYAEYGRDWVNLDPPRHLTLFTRSSLQRALDTAGFTGTRFPAPWSGTAWMLASSRALREGRTPRFDDPGPKLPDVLALARPRQAEELVAIAMRAPGGA